MRIGCVGYRAKSSRLCRLFASQFVPHGVYYGKVMKIFQHFTMIVGLAVAVSFSASAQGIESSSGDSGAGISMEGDTDKPKKKKKKSEKTEKKTSPVGKAVGKLKTFNGKPSKKALVYIYLQSASWCPPCNQEMPGVVEAYKEMKKDGRAEIILVGHDSTEDAAKKFLKKYKAKFAGVLSSDKKVADLPGFTLAEGIPNAIMVDAEGNVLASGFPSGIIPQWKQAVEQLEAAAEE